MSDKLATVRVDFLAGLALDYSVAKALGLETSEDGLSMWVKKTDGSGESYLAIIPCYSEKLPWAWSVLQDLPIEYRISTNGVLASFVDGERWLGNNYIQAGLRCFVASKFPNGIIEIPAGLAGV